MEGFAAGNELFSECLDVVCDADIKLVRENVLNRNISASRHICKQRVYIVFGLEHNRVLGFVGPVKVATHQMDRASYIAYV